MRLVNNNLTILVNLDFFDFPILLTLHVALTSLNSASIYSRYLSLVTTPMAAPALVLISTLMAAAMALLRTPGAPATPETWAM